MTNSEQAMLENHLWFCDRCSQCGWLGWTHSLGCQELWPLIVCLQGEPPGLILMLWYALVTFADSKPWKSYLQSHTELLMRTGLSQNKNQLGTAFINTYSDSGIPYCEGWPQDWFWKRTAHSGAHPVSKWFPLLTEHKLTDDKMIVLSCGWLKTN